MKIFLGGTMAENLHPSRNPQNDHRANAEHLKQVLCDFKPSSLFFGQWSVQK